MAPRQLSGFFIIVKNPDGSQFINIKNAKQQESGIYTWKAFNQDVVMLSSWFSGRTFSKSELTAESRLFQERTLSDLLIYTISTDQGQVIPSEP